MPKTKSSQSGRDNRPRRHKPLPEDIADTGVFRPVSNKRKSRHDDEADGADNYIDSKASRRIFRIGKELADEDRDDAPDQVKNTAFGLASRLDQQTGSDDEGAESDDAWVDEDAWGDGDEDDMERELVPGDLAIFNRFLPSADDTSLRLEPRTEEQAGVNLAELILEKINEHEDRQVFVDRDPSAEPEGGVELPAKVVEAYTRVGILLSRYKSGKLPKLFKVLPTLPNWEEILAITRPDSWTPNACYEATRIFVSRKPATVQSFLQTIILDRVREDIHETKKLNVHLYKALKKALYNPAAFFKGFLFPLIASGTCTLREAHIVSSVLARVSVPVLHSAAALLRLCDMAAEQASMSTEGGGATNIFIRVLLEKKYALPFKVIDALVFHFLRFKGAQATAVAAESTADQDSAADRLSSTRLPVLWHRCLLVFAQRYRNDITEDQREALLDLLLVKGHHAIGPEVRRELLEGRGRGMPVPQPAALDGDDDTMMIDSEMPATALPLVSGVMA
ncbi:MAG: snoRNA-binding rRNA-processing protein [Lichina confinis]|nr:MAG: snoRNA-binding rRNA-processing protein [Lichina confinis]